MFMAVCIPGASSFLLITLVTHLYSSYLILWGNDLKGPDEVLVRRSFFHWSNLFISSTSSTTVGDFYEYSHNMAAVPVIFSTVEQCSDGIFHIEFEHLKKSEIKTAFMHANALFIYLKDDLSLVLKTASDVLHSNEGCGYLHCPLCVFSHTCHLTYSHHA